MRNTPGNILSLSANTPGLLQQPLLDDEIEPATPPHQFLQLENWWFSNTPTEQIDAANVATTQATTEVINEEEAQLIALGILGRPYASESTFWCQQLPLSILLGALLGPGTFLIVSGSRNLLALWCHVESLEDHGHWKWLIVTALGGLLSALLLSTHYSPNPGGVRAFFQDASDLIGDAREAPLILLSSIACLATGVPLGPEISIGVLGSGLGVGLAGLFGCNSRTTKTLVQVGISGAFAGLLPSPVLCVLLVHELAAVGRADRFTVDALIQSEGTSKLLKKHDSDYMELLTLGGAAATTAFVVIHLLLPHSIWKPEYELNGDYAHWHLGASILLGICCGIAGFILMIFTGIFRTIRIATCKVLKEKLKLHSFLIILIFPTLAGFLHGMLAIYNPLLIGTGVRWIGDLIENTNGRQVDCLLFIAFCKIIGVSLCSGFGLVGGAFFPMVFVGACLGVAFGSILPLSLTIPACIAATVGSISPIPFTLTICVTLTLSLSVDQMGPVFVATITGFTVVGGFGIIQKLGEKWLVGTRLLQEHNIDEHREDGYDEHTSEEDILVGIRSMIFSDN